MNMYPDYHSQNKSYNVYTAWKLVFLEILKICSPVYRTKDTLNSWKMYKSVTLLIIGYFAVSSYASNVEVGLMAIGNHASRTNLCTFGRIELLLEDGNIQR